MKKARIILTAIVMFAIIGSTLAFKTLKSPPWRIWTTYGVTTTTATITVGGPYYTATVPNCVLIPFFPTDDAPFPNQTRISATGIVKATVYNGTATTFVTYRACPIVIAFPTIVQ